MAAALAFASPASALRPNTLESCWGFSATYKQFAPTVAKIWDLTRWRREKPKAVTIAAERRALQCAAGPEHRREIRELWRLSKHRFYVHRRSKLERLRHLPFDCGGGVRSAIDCYVMWCESGGSYTARNSDSTAGGKYQILDSTWAAYGGRSYSSSHPAAVAPAAEQDRVASAIWADVGSSAWACA